MFARSTCALLLLLLAASAPTYAQGAGSLSDADKAAIKSLLEDRFTQLAIDHDWDALASLLSEKVNWMPAGAPAVAKRAGTQAWIKQNWDVLPISEFTQNVDEIDGRGDLAFARGKYSITVEIEGAPRIHDVGKYLIILERAADGSWLISNAMYSRDTDKPQVGE